MGNSMKRMVLITALVSTAACGGAHQGRSAPSAVLQIECEHKGAEVWLNSDFLHELDTMPNGIRLKPGEYRIEIRHADFHSRYYSFQLQSGEQKQIVVQLAPRFNP